MGTKGSKSSGSQKRFGRQRDRTSYDNFDQADIPIMPANFSFEDLAYEDTSAQARTDRQPLSAERDDDEALRLTNPNRAPIVTLGDKPKYFFKIVILGEMQTGKTALAGKIAKNMFPTKYRATIGTDFYEKKIITQDCLLQFWDIAGQERFGNMLPVFLRETNAIILTYDVTNRKTFEALSKWLDLVDAAFKQSDTPQVYIAGNKTDLPNKDETVINDAKDYAKEENVNHHLVSAKNGEGLDELITQIANDLVKLEPPDQQSDLQAVGKAVIIIKDQKLTDQSFTQEFFAQRRRDQPLGKAILAGLFKYGMYGDIVWYETFGIGSLPTTRKELNAHLQTTRGKNSTSAKTYQTVANLPEFSN